jgi:hypothetical protein
MDDTWCFQHNHKFEEVVTVPVSHEVPAAQFKRNVMLEVFIN